MSWKNSLERVRWPTFPAQIFQHFFTWRKFFPDVWQLYKREIQLVNVGSTPKSRKTWWGVGLFLSVHRWEGYPSLWSQVLSGGGVPQSLVPLLQPLISWGATKVRCWNRGTPSPPARTRTGTPPPRPFLVFIRLDVFRENRQKLHKVDAPSPRRPPKVRRSRSEILHPPQKELECYLFTVPHWFDLSTSKWYNEKTDTSESAIVNCCLVISTQATKRK